MIHIAVVGKLFTLLLLRLYWTKLYWYDPNCSCQQVVNSVTMTTVLNQTLLVWSTLQLWVSCSLCYYDDCTQPNFTGMIQIAVVSKLFTLLLWRLYSTKLYMVWSTLQLSVCCSLCYYGNCTEPNFTSMIHIAVVSKLFTLLLWQLYWTKFTGVIHIAVVRKLFTLLLWRLFSSKLYWYDPHCRCR